jgi:PAS domain S-box-containing protein
MTISLLNILAILLVLAIILVVSLLILLLLKLLRPFTGKKQHKDVLIKGLDGVATLQKNDIALLADTLSAVNETLRKKISRLYRQERLYQELVQSTNSIILRLDKEAKIIFMNRYGLDFFGFTANEIIGHNVVGTILPKTDTNGKDLEAMIKRILQDPEKYQSNKNENLCKDGSRVLLKWSNKAIVDEDGSFLELLCVGIDITALNRAEKKLQEKERLYQALFESSHDAHFLFKNWHYIDSNQAGLALLGCTTKRQLIGAPADSFTPEVQPDGVPTLQKIRQIKEKAFSGKTVTCEWYARSRDGTVRLTEANIHCIQTGAGKILHFSLRDLTQQKRLEEELRQSQKMEAIGTLAGGIAHDFNNILTAIMGYTDLALIKVKKPSPVADALHQVLTASRRASELVRQILTFSRQEDQAKQAVQISLIVREAVQMLRSSIPPGIKLVEDITSTNLVLANPTQIHQLIINLCTNSLQAMRKNGGTLSVSLRDVTGKLRNDAHGRPVQSGNYVHLVVKDTGHGISTKVIKKIFDPYFTTRGYGKGAGLGLAVVHGILQSHKAKIKVDSKPRQGTSFSIYFPAAPTAAIATAADTKKKDPAAKPGVDKAAILFADDEQAIRDLVQTYLEKYGYQLTTCKNGEEAWKKFAAEPAKWDLLVTDQNMPRMTGTELIQKIRKIRPDIPIILATGYSENISAEEFVNLNISAMLQKPTPMNKMVEYIRKTLKKPRR